MDALPQARLVTELKLAIDARDSARIDRLIRQNPRSIMASHVLRNIGKRRAAAIWYRIPEVIAGELEERAWRAPPRRCEPFPE